MQSSKQLRYTADGCVQAAQPAVSNTEEAAHKKARNGVHENLTPQQSAAGAPKGEPDNAASVAPQPISGGFGGLASKADSGFAFGGGAVFGNGAAFGGGGGGASVSFGGNAVGNANASSAAFGGGAPSFASKASQHGAVNGAGTFSEASNAGPAAQGGAQNAIRAAMSDAATPAEEDQRVFGSQQQAGQLPDMRGLAFWTAPIQSVTRALPCRRSAAPVNSSSILHQTICKPGLQQLVKFALVLYR